MNNDFEFFLQFFWHLIFTACACIGGGAFSFWWASNHIELFMFQLLVSIQPYRIVYVLKLSVLFLHLLFSGCSLQCCCCFYVNTTELTLAQVLTHKCFPFKNRNTFVTSTFWSCCTIFITNAATYIEQFVIGVKNLYKFYRLFSLIEAWLFLMHSSLIVLL